MPLFFEGQKLTHEDLNASSILSISALNQRSKDFTNIPCKNLSSEDKILYVNQREYATVQKKDSLIRFIGSEDATTCHIIVMKTKEAISVGHFDGSGTEEGLLSMTKQLIQSVSSNAQNPEMDIESVFIELHIFGGFLDDRGISEELLTDILIFLCNIPVHFSIKTACVYAVNNRFVHNNNKPIICGIAVDVNSGEIFPSTFSYKGPNEIIRHARVFGGAEEMLNVYDSISKRFIIKPFFYRVPQSIAILLSLSDDQILQNLSTSPHCEPEYFASTTRKTLQFLLENPNPRTVFKDWQPLVYEMDEGGLWR